MKAIETDRLIIRNFQLDDWRDLQELVVQYAASDVAQYDHRWPTSAQEIKGVAEWFASGDRFLAVCLKATGRFIGFISSHRDEGEGSLEFGLGYIYHPRYRGKGYATEGCRALIDHAFGELGADRVTSSTALANDRSCRLLRRLGMRETGRSTASFRQTENGEPVECDAVSFALSRADWQARNPAPGPGQEAAGKTDL